MRVCYGLVGMTRGHAARALAIGQELIDRGHEVLFCKELDTRAATGFLTTEQQLLTHILTLRFGEHLILPFEHIAASCCS